jgi:hypothetical protein
MPESIDEITFEEIKERVHRAIRRFLKENNQLLKFGLQEQTNSMKMVSYLDDEFPDWDVDGEYNKIVDKHSEECQEKTVFLMMKRSGYKIEYLVKAERVRVRPDIIIHRRGTIENLLAIEIKLSENQEQIEYDWAKLDAYCQNHELRYRFGLFIPLYKINIEEGLFDEDDLLWFRRED